MSLLQIFGISSGGWIVSVLYLAAIYGFIAYFMQSKATEKSQVRWTPFESAGVTLFVYFFSQLFAGISLYIILGVFGWDEARITDWFSNVVVGQFVVTVCIDAVTLGLLILFLKRRSATLKTIGLKGRLALRDIGYAVGGYLIYIVIYIAIASVVGKLIPAINLDQKQQLGFDNVSSLQLPLVFLSLVVMPPIIEELVMRGFLYTGLRNKLPKWTAALLTSGLFAVAHLQAGSGAPLLWVAAIDTFILSMVLIELKERSGSLRAPILLHALKNLIAFLSLFVFHLV
jgi:membrane protease YdiL (CAAX protease family)